MNDVTAVKEKRSNELAAARFFCQFHPGMKQCWDFGEEFAGELQNLQNALREKDLLTKIERTLEVFARMEQIGENRAGNSCGNRGMRG